MPKSLTRSITVYAQLNPQGDPFSYKPEVDRTLEIIGLVLWATEGDKTQISLANGNVAIIKKYLEFLRVICHFKEEKIKAVIHCHDSLSYDKCLSHWSKLTSIPPERFNKPFIKHDHGGTRKYPYGILRIVGYNVKLIQLFKERLKDLGLERG